MNRELSFIENASGTLHILSDLLLSILLSPIFYFHVIFLKLKKVIYTQC